MSKQLIESLKENVIQGRRDKDDEGLEKGMVGHAGVKELTEQAIHNGISPKGIIEEGLSQGMKIVGDKYEAGEYFIPDMLAAAEAVGVAMDVLEPHLVKSGIKPRGKIVMATVKGDLHDIGKNIVSILLKGAGYVVRDLSSDVAPERIIEAVKEEEPDFLGLSALLTTTMMMMKITIEKLEEAGLRQKVKVIIGGAPTSEEFAKEIGADGYGADGFQAVKVVEALKSSEGNS